MNRAAPLAKPAVLAELRKMPAFVRRDFMVAWSYRLAFVSDAINLVVQAITFSFVNILVDQSKMPEFGGIQASYFAFVAVGIVLGGFLQLGLGQMMAAIRNEQLMGTLESLFMTPTRPITLQLGLVVYDLIYVPIRTVIFLVLVSAWFDIAFRLDQLGPALGILFLFIPLVWGIGLTIAALVLTFRRGAGLVGLIGAALSIGSGAYFPLVLLPRWLAATAAINPIAIAFEGAREALLGGAGWSEIAPNLLRLAPAAALSLAVGAIAFNLALRRERRMGTLGLY